MKFSANIVGLWSLLQALKVVCVCLHIKKEKKISLPSEDNLLQMGDFCVNLLAVIRICYWAEIIFNQTPGQQTGEFKHILDHNKSMPNNCKRRQKYVNMVALMICACILLQLSKWPMWHVIYWKKQLLPLQLFIALIIHSISMMLCLGMLHTNFIDKMYKFRLFVGPSFYDRQMTKHSGQTCYFANFTKMCSLGEN